MGSCFYAIMYDNINIVKKFMDNEEESESFQYESRDYGITSVELCLHNENLDMLKLLLSSEYDFIDAEDSMTNHEFILYHSVQFENLEFVKYCIEELGVDVNQEIKTCVNKTTALIEASSRKNLEIVEYLVENGACVDKGYGFRSPLSQAFYELRKKNVEYLVNNSKNLPEQYINEGFLITAILAKWFNIAVSLIDKGVDVNQRNLGDGAKYPLFAALEVENEMIIEKLLENGADPTLTETNSETVLEIARKFNSDEIVEIILKYIK